VWPLLIRTSAGHITRLYAFPKLLWALLLTRLRGELGMKTINQIKSNLLVAFLSAVCAGLLDISEARAQVYINEMVASAQAVEGALADEDETYPDWIELYNAGSDPVNLNGYLLSSKKTKTTTWTFPSVAIEPKGYLLVFASNKNRVVPSLPLHTNFAIDKGGEEISLISNQGLVIDTLPPQKLSSNQSYGNATDGRRDRIIFTTPSPGCPNGGTVGCVPQRAVAPSFSVAGGFFSKPPVITLTSSEASHRIHYTLDGTEPSPTSQLYSGPISLAAVANPNTTAQVVRARTYASGKMPSLIETNTYFVNEPSTLTVVSIVADRKKLDLSGILTCPGFGDPCFEAEVPASLELYESNRALGLKSSVGLGIMGNSTSLAEKKPLVATARTQYGTRRMSYAFFPNRCAVKGEVGLGDCSETFKEIGFRNGSYKTDPTFIKDALAHKIVEGMMDIDSRDYRPAVLFINGSYYGFVQIRERINEHYAEPNFGYTNEDIQFPYTNQTVGDPAAESAYNSEVNDFISTNNMALDSSIAHLRSKIDIDELINYDIVKRFTGAVDWASNIKFWRVTPGKERAPGASRWRWILFDDDDSFWGPDGDAIANIRIPVTSMPVANLMENASIRSDYLQRFAIYLNTVFAPNRLTGIVDGMKGEIEAEIPRYSAFVGARESDWISAVNNLRTFVEQRAGYLRSFLEKNYNLPPSVTLSISVSPEDGTLAINDVIVGAQYSGLHFAGVPIRIKAIPNKNVAFWSWSTSQTTPEITLQLTSDTNLTANMYAREDKIVINEIHYSPLTTVDHQFIELFNKDSVARSLDGYSITSGVRHTFAPGTVIPANGYLVLARNKSAIASMVPAGVLVVQWDQGTLSAQGEAIVLRDAPGTGKIVDSVTYQPGGVWTDIPIKFSASLQLVNPFVDGRTTHLWRSLSSGELGSGFTPGSINSTFLSEECPRNAQGIAIPNPSTCLERAGDVNLSGTVTTADITIMRRVILGTMILPRIAFINGASVAESRDALTSADIAVARRCILGLDPMDFGACRR
jgi:hypothetical protein